MDRRDIAASSASQVRGLPPLRLVNRRTQEHVGACPFCGGQQDSDRFHVWMEPGRERYWCRACDAKGPLSRLLGEEIRPRPAATRRGAARPAAPAADPTRQGSYRQIYATVALWAHGLLLDPANPDPAAYLRRRGLGEGAIRHHLLGATLRDPAAIPELLRRECPELLPYAEEAGVLSRDRGGELRGHPNLCGSLIFPYIAGGEVVDLRARSYPGKGYRSLPGGYESRGATLPFGWDDLDGAETILLTEGEFKAIAATEAYREGRLSAPALAHPGLSYLRDEWPAMLADAGVRTVVLAYDSGPRPVRDGVLQLAPEEIWGIRHGLRLAAAGLEVRVLRLPLAPGQEKADLDAFLLERGAPGLQLLIDTAPALRAYHRSLPRGLLAAAKLPPPGDYPTRRARPQPLGAAGAPRAAPPTADMSAMRATIAESVRDHALGGRGFLVLAHPPGAGKGHNTVAGLRAYLQAHEAPGQIVWAAPRKEQIRDQHGLELTPLHGRNPGNCRRIGEAMALSARGYSVREALCRRRCPFVDHCHYLRQFGQEADFFAPLPLLQATGWWREAGVLILDEFDPARLTRVISLDSADLAAMARATRCPHARAVLRWVGLALASASDRQLSGGTLLAELEAAARAEGLDLAATLRAACDGLPAEEEQLMLLGLPQGAGLADYEALPPNHLATLVERLAREQRAHLSGAAFTSRLELSGGRLMIFTRIEHLIAQLADSEQPKVILDATVSAPLLEALFPGAPIRVERPGLAGGAHVVQVISRDWAKSGLRGERRERWYDEVSAQLRPGRPTLVVCTLGCEEGLRDALRARGHTGVQVGHYGALRGSNAYKGHDVLLAQVYHPNLEAVMREGRALFADDGPPLDERVIVTERVLEDASGARWAVQVPTFADERLAALLENRREAEMVQCAMRGRPLDHPEAQITLMFGLPLPGFAPTVVLEGGASPESNAGRQEGAKARLVAAAQRLLGGRGRAIGVSDLADAAGASVATVQKYWDYVAISLGLRPTRRGGSLVSGARRTYHRMTLIRRGRAAPPKQDEKISGGSSGAVPNTQEDRRAYSTDPRIKDHARNKYYITRVIFGAQQLPRSCYCSRKPIEVRATGPPA